MIYEHKDHGTKWLLREISKRIIEYKLYTLAYNNLDETEIDKLLLTYYPETKRDQEIINYFQRNNISKAIKR